MRTLRAVRCFSPSLPHQSSLSKVILHLVSFAVTFPLLIPPLCLTTRHIVHTSPAALPRPPRKTRKTRRRPPAGHMVPRPPRLLAGSAPDAAQHVRRRFAALAYHHKTHVMSRFHTAATSPAASRGHPPLLPAGCYCPRWQVADTSRLRLSWPIAGSHCSAGSQSCRRCTCSVRYVCWGGKGRTAGSACAHVGCCCITTVGGALQLCPLLVRQNQRCSRSVVSPAETENRR